MLAEAHVAVCSCAIHRINLLPAGQQPLLHARQPIGQQEGVDCNGYAGDTRPEAETLFRDAVTGSVHGAVTARPHRAAAADSAAAAAAASRAQRVADAHDQGAGGALDEHRLRRLWQLVCGQEYDFHMASLRRHVCNLALATASKHASPECFQVSRQMLSLTFVDDVRPATAAEVLEAVLLVAVASAAAAAAVFAADTSAAAAAATAAVVFAAGAAVLTAAATVRDQPAGQVVQVQLLGYGTADAGARCGDVAVIRRAPRRVLQSLRMCNHWLGGDRIALGLTAHLQCIITGRAELWYLDRRKQVQPAMQMRGGRRAPPRQPGAAGRPRPGRCQPCPGGAAALPPYMLPAETSGESCSSTEAFAPEARTAAVDQHVRCQARKTMRGNGTAAHLDRCGACAGLDLQHVVQRILVLAHARPLPSQP